MLSESCNETGTIHFGQPLQRDHGGNPLHPFLEDNVVKARNL